MRAALARDRLFIACGVGASFALSAVLVAGGAQRERGPDTEVMVTPMVVEAPRAPAGLPVAMPTASRAVGVVVPVTQWVVRARVDGFVLRRLKAAGERVAAGGAVSLLDDADLLLERDKCNARAEAATHRCAAARADLRALERLGEQLRASQATRSATPFELTHNQCQVEAAAARVKALEGDCKEAAADRLAVERRIKSCVCVTPIEGRVSEAPRAEGDYVRTGEAVAVVESLRRQIRVKVPGSLADRVGELSFRLAGLGTQDVLKPAERLWGFEVEAGRSVALEIPAGVQLEAGRTVDVEMVTR
jgi:multidrug efflux pump subunit AcrA (membrane-fusion protein)